MTQKFSDNDITYFSSGGVNAINSIPGQGTYLLSNYTSYLPQTNAVSKIHVMMLVLYIKNQLITTLKEFLFENNDAATRQRVINAATPILQSILATNGVSSYTLTCDESNNTAAVIAAGNLVLDVGIAIVYPSTNITIRVENPQGVKTLLNG
jgi:phage tail sheath protein FI